MENTENIYFVVRDDQDAQHVIYEEACSCGYHAVADQEHHSMRCPICGARVMTRFHKSVNTFSWDRVMKRETYHPLVNLAESPDDISFDIGIRTVEVDIDTLHEIGNIISIGENGEHYRRVSIQMAPHFEAKIWIGGKQVNPTISNLRKALAHVSPDKLDRFYQQSLPSSEKQPMIFSVMAERLSTTSMANVACLLMKYPFLEKLYQSDHKLYLYPYLFQDGELKDGVEELLDVDARRSHEILRVSKPMFHFLEQHCMALKCGGLGFTQVFSLISRYGMEKTLHILELTMHLANHTNYSDVPAGWVNLILDDRLHYDLDALASYLLDSLYTYQGIENVALGSQLLYDYVNMCLSMDIKYERYPRSLKLAHDLTAKNYKIVLEEITRQKFHQVVSTSYYTDLTYQDGDYCVIAPKEADELVFEGAALNHCVGSYIRDVVDKGVRIYFMRRKDMSDDPLITLDVRNGSLIQAAGMTNRSPTETEAAFIQKWIAAKKLKARFVF